jgi:tetratricopeptide (TPR) repeat protein
VSADQREIAEDALRWYRRASWIGSGGIALSTAPQGAMDVRSAWLLCVLDRFDEAESLLRATHARDDSETSASALAMILRNRRDEAKNREALELYERTLAAHPEYAGMLADYEPLAMSLGRIDNVLAIHRARLERDPGDVHSIRVLCVLYMNRGDLDQLLAMAKRWSELDSRNPDAHRIYALALADAQRMDQAIIEMSEALRLSPDDPDVRTLLADMLQSIGRTQEAEAVRQGR